MFDIHVFVYKSMLALHVQEAPSKWIVVFAFH